MGAKNGWRKDVIMVLLLSHQWRSEEQSAAVAILIIIILSPTLLLMLVLKRVGDISLLCLLLSAADSIKMMTGRA